VHARVLTSISRDLKNGHGRIKSPYKSTALVQAEGTRVTPALAALSNLLDCVSSSRIDQNIGPRFWELLISHSVFTEWDDVIVDVHKQTTMIEVRILCTPPAEFPGQHSWQPRCLQRQWLPNSGRPRSKFRPKITGETLPFPFRITQLDI
jgi:hypothetical protein